MFKSVSLDEKRGFLEE